MSERADCIEATACAMFLANTLFIALSHVLFVVGAAIVLLATLPVAYFVHYGSGAVLLAIIAVASTIRYQRIGHLVEALLRRIGVDRPVARALPDYYVAGLSIFHLAPLLVVLYCIDGSVWIHQHRVAQLSSIGELPQEGKEGIYHVADSKAVSSLQYAYSNYRNSGSRAAGTVRQMLSTTWRVMPLVSGAAEGPDVELSVNASEHCVWLGTNDKGNWIEDRLRATDGSAFFLQRDSQDVRRYFDVLRNNVADLPACARILERAPAPEVVQQRYWKASALVLGLAHGIPLALLLVFWMVRSIRRGKAGAS